MNRVSGSGRIERKGNGKYKLRVFLGYTPDGRKRERSKTVIVTGQTESAQERNAKAELRRFIASIETEVCTSDNITFEALVNLWLKEISSVKHCASTIDWYKRMLVRSTKYLANKRIEDIHVKEVDSYVAWLKNGEQLSNKNINRHLRVLSTLLNQAVKWEFIYKNPCLSVSPLDIEGVEHHIYNEVSVNALIKKLSPYELRYQLYVLLPLFCGLRREEVIALRMSDIDLEKRLLHIKSAVIYGGKDQGVIQKAPKSRSSKRSVEIPLFLLPILNQYISNEVKLRQELRVDKRYKDTLFINHRTGKCLFPTTPTHWFAKFLMRNNLPKITYHELRHTYTSLLYEDNIDLAKISKSLGHSNVATTTQVYVHAVKTTEQLLATSLDNRFGSIFSQEDQA